MQSLIEQQYAIEEEAIGLGQSTYTENVRKAKARKDTTGLAPENSLIKSSILAISKQIDTHIAEHVKGGKEYQFVRNVMMHLAPEELAFLTLQTCLCYVDAEPTVHKVSLEVGDKVRKQLDYVSFKRENPAYLKRVEETMNSKHARYKAVVLGITMDKKGFAREHWNQTQTVQVGAFLINRMVEAVNLYSIKMIRKGNKTEMRLKMSQEAIDWLDKAHEKCAEMSPQYLPMVIKPSSWDAMYTGGFLNAEGAYRISAIRCRNQDVLDDISTRANLTQVYDCLNTLQATPWCINRQVLEVMIEGSKTGMGGLTCPDIELLLDAPFWESDAEFQELKETSPEKIKAWKVGRAEAYDEWNRTASHRRSLQWQLWIANKFKEYEEIFFCWNCDWRGRVYPIQTHLNPQADKNGKALLQFAKGLPLGDTGAYWLAVHGANTFGKDKLPMDERVDWIKEHQEEILDSARNPLDGNRFWCEADEPYMFLAFCFEWAGYVAEGNDWVSHLPVNMDGSCSGLQHYSAMLKDEIGGAFVNLIPQVKPADVYMKVAEVANGIIARDTENEMAQTWHGKIDRTIAKRNTMTWAYSATRYGFADQLMNELTKRDAELKAKGGGAYLGDSSINQQAANYMAGVNLEAIGHVVVKAVEGMEFLKEIAKAVTESGKIIEWTTPSDMLVIHRYVEYDTCRVKTLFGSSTIRLSTGVENGKAHTKKNKAAIAPNFIHSMDASHLVLTVNECVRQGIESFAMIHDSFGTHAGNVEKMNTILREEFIKMYDGDVLNDFLAQIKEQVPEIADKLPAPLKQGNLDLQGVRESRYFFA